MKVIDPQTLTPENIQRLLSRAQQAMKLHQSHHPPSPLAPRRCHTCHYWSGYIACLTDLAHSAQP